MGSIDRLFRDLGLQVFERGWLSSNGILFGERESAPATLLDTGYVAHEEQTAALVVAALGGRPLQRVVNSHLHSDHCGGNARLQALFGCEVRVPAPSLDAVRDWDESSLSFRGTGQRCRRFTAQRAIESGEVLRLGAGDWLAIAAPGHDPDALMFFEQRARVLISGDALWEDRVSILFPEFDGGPGFAGARAALDVIESLEPQVVIPGHGRPFFGVRSAIERSRARIAAFERDPGKHASYGARALTMFHMLEHRRRRVGDLHAWLCATPVFSSLYDRLDRPPATLETFSVELVRGLVASGQLRLVEDDAVEIAR